MLKIESTTRSYASALQQSKIVSRYAQLRSVISTMLGHQTADL